MSYSYPPPSTSSSIHAELDRLYSRRSAVDRLIQALEMYRLTVEPAPDLPELCAAATAREPASPGTTSH
jgi:hypothetical protein